MCKAFKRAASKLRNAVPLFLNNAISQLSGAAPSPLAGPLAAWMPPSSLHGRVHGVSRKR
ncbi:hypothetical protein EBA01_04845 [Xanthomonas oryzae pv. oryzae]|nr:hypothetical protein BVV16_04960 [Xanthomonas oryzae pv. oryzae]AUI96016.1 hypothetical protein BVV17_04960 [Xanthomonas oryzae pv. oryzae]AUI99687.1 hypothetical protein BVV18_04965 [Xanthomonas oryzae pv. oryzae]AUJ03368.1 hypothetical protein BVV10_04965 [Xanthomonas oryzae pv. oryzae]AUJ07032.1 hypothetical protein BVV19_04970 [Xanthomonas oryzae pv. oryzae]